MKVREVMLKRLSKKMIIFIGVSIVLITLMTIDCFYNFEKMEAATNEYIACEIAAEELLESSEYLEEMILLCADTGDLTYLNHYFEELHVNRRQEDAVRIFEQYFHGTDMLVHMEEALSHSADLREIDFHVLKLVAEANSFDTSSLPAEITDYVLEPGEKTLDKEEMMRTAILLISGEEYQTLRENIMAAVDRGVESLLTETAKIQETANFRFIRSFIIILTMVVFFALFMIFVVYVMLKKVVEPLELYNDCIKAGKIFPVVGAHELQMLAETYNRVFEENQENEKLLRHEAEHDAMTGVYNKGSFTRLMEVYEKSQSPYALILIDVDNFKHFNDTYGHEIGDQVLIKVASTLKRYFRSTDYPCRIGGDEFSLIMVEMDSSLKNTLVEKLLFIEKALKNTDDGLPQITLSIGVAFSDRENPKGTIFQDADAAMYEVKKRGRDGYQIYE